MTLSRYRVDNLYDNVKGIIEDARASIYRSANFAMVQSYWKIGKLIVEEEQNGKDRAEYGKELIKRLAVRLSDISNSPRTARRIELETLSAAVEKDVIELSPEQILMLEMSDNDIKNNNVIAQDDLDKEDLKWLKAL